MVIVPFWMVPLPRVKVLVMTCEPRLITPPELVTDPVPSA